MKRLAFFILLLGASAQAVAQSAAPPKAPGQVLVPLSTGTDPERAMDAAYRAFAGRKWAVSRDAEGALVARHRNFDVDATLKVFIGDGALRYIDGTVALNKSAKAQVPERWLNYIRADLRHALATPAQPAAGAKGVDPTERLRRLRSMLDAGLISQAEYDAKRAEILKGL